MRVLVAEDDLASRRLLFKIFSQYGTCDLVVDGMEALDAYVIAMQDKKPYDLICLDIMMPKIDGVQVLKAIRDVEGKKGIPHQEKSKIIITTALEETQYVQKAIAIGCQAYTTKPISSQKLMDIIEELGILGKTRK